MSSLQLPRKGHGKKWESRDKSFEKGLTGRSPDKAPLASEKVKIHVTTVSAERLLPASIFTPKGWQNRSEG